MKERTALTVPLLVAALIAVYSVNGCTTDFRDALESHGSANALDALEAQLDELEATVQAIADHRAVWDRELLYTRGLDRHDEELINDTFWPDAEASYGTLVSMDEFAVWANESHAEYAAHQHHVTGVSVDVGGDTAHEEGYIVYSSNVERDTARDTRGASTPGRVVPNSYATLGSGRYVNRYERRNGEWRIRVHEYVHDVSMRLEAVDLCAHGCLGRWDRTDISYMRPLEPLSLAERRRRAHMGGTPASALAPQASEE